MALATVQKRRTHTPTSNQPSNQFTPNVSSKNLQQPQQISQPRTPNTLHAKTTPIRKLCISLETTPKNNFVASVQLQMEEVIPNLLMIKV
jgi:hypothetical protein